MPLVPQFRAEAPPGPQAPTLQRENRARVDPADALRGLGAMAGIIRRGAPQMRRIDPNLGQATGQGMQSIGEGLKDVGDATYEIEKRAAEIRNRYALFESETEMESVRAKFDKWRLLNANTPEKWESKWSEMMNSSRDNYLKGKELAPAAQDAINMQWGSYASRVQAQVGVDYVRRTVQMGGEAIRASYLKNVEAGNLEGAIANAREGTSLGIWGPDEEETMKLRAMDDVEAKQLADGKNMIDFFLVNGDVDSALGTLETMPMPDPERMLYKARIEKIEAVKIEEGKILDRLSEGADPAVIKAELEAKDADGNHLNHPALSAVSRAKLIEPLNKIVIEERDEQLKVIGDAIDAREIDNEAELMRALEPVGANPVTVSLLQKKLRLERIDTEEEVVGMQIKAANYDPKTDPEEVIYQSIREQARIVFGTPRPPLMGQDPRLGDVTDMLERRRQGQSLTPGQEVVAQALKQTKDLVEAGGAWKIPADRVLMVEEEDGTKSFIDTGATIKPEAADYYQDKRGYMSRAWAGKTPFVGKVNGRKLLLSQDDEIAVEQGKAITVEDINARNRALGAAAPKIDQIRKELEDGTIKTVAEATEKFGTLILPMAKDAALEAISGAPLMPPAQAAEASAAPKGVDISPDAKKRWLEAGMTF